MLRSRPAILAVMLVAAALAASAQAQFALDTEAGPRFRPDGPEADAYGRNEGYPSCTRFAYIGDLRCRVGAFSHFDDAVSGAHHRGVRNRRFP